MSDYTSLGIAIVIDIVTAIPFDVTGIGLIIEVPLLAIEASFLKSLGVSSMKSIFGAAMDFIPVLDIMPWCTMAVLDRKFGIKIPYVTKIFNR
jgi:hypothetical protein